MKNCQCLTEPDISFNPETRDIGGKFADSWTFAHATISQKFFQLDPEEGKRAVALIVDWTKTKDRFYSFSTQDESSNKTFQPDTLARTEAETDAAMAKALRDLTGQNVNHNEVRTCRVRKDSLVGLI